MSDIKKTEEIINESNTDENKTENLLDEEFSTITKEHISPVEYILLVDSLADSFFSDTGVYQPEIGELWAIAQFYNVNVEKSNLDEKFKDNPDKKKADIMDVGELLEDVDFELAYLTEAHIDLPLTFGGAYARAKEIVEQKNSTLGGITDVITNALKSLTDHFSPLLTDENIANVATIAKDIKDGKISAEAVVDAYGKSQRFQDVVNSGEKDIPNSEIDENPHLEIVEKD